jgi:FMN phosphatase YigB (HAD superfamily)
MMRAVSFDLDGTLYSLARARGPLLWSTFPRWRTLRVGRAVREELRGRRFRTGDDLLATEAQLVGERLDISPAAARAALDDIFATRLTRVLRRIGPISGARAALDDVVARGIQLALVSDRGAALAKLEALGFADLPWGVVVSADDTGILKPDAEVLMKTAQRLNIAPHELLHVGDRDDADGAAARAAGCAWVIIDPTRPRPLDVVAAALDAPSSSPISTTEPA